MSGSLQKSRVLVLCPDAIRPILEAHFKQAFDEWFDVLYEGCFHRYLANDPAKLLAIVVWRERGDQLTDSETLFLREAVAAQTPVLVLDDAGGHFKSWAYENLPVAEGTLARYEEVIGYSYFDHLHHFLHSYRTCGIVATSLQERHQRQKQLAG